MVMYPLNSLKAGIVELLDKFGLVSGAAAKTRLLAAPATAIVKSGGFPAFAGMYYSGGNIPASQLDVVGENGPEILGRPVIDAQPWLISKVTHNLSSGEYTTQLEFEVLLSDVEY